jgi:hypothetical protein
MEHQNIIRSVIIIVFIWNVSVAPFDRHKAEDTNIFMGKYTSEKGALFHLCTSFLLS